ncbi:MAG: hypothetical protein HQM11_12070 [SAR324 cluster bacterium]|nr:hypothetical protein [SAR324 cluster bacterium]
MWPDVNYHPGRAFYIDGTDVEINKTAFKLQKILIPEGEHVITFRFRSAYPWLFYSQLVLIPLGWGMIVFYLGTQKIKQYSDPLLTKLTGVYNDTRNQEKIIF